VRDFVSRIEKCIADDAKNIKFKEAFKTYKLSKAPNIDEFSSALFEIFLGDADHAVSHLDVERYAEKNEIMKSMGAQVDPRHKERYLDLVTCRL
jgi:hypothetical protein